jgi:hypothetical protein
MMSSGTVVNWASVALRVPASWASEVLEQDMRLPVEHPMALLNDGKADGLREARARAPEKEGIGMLRDPAGGGEVEDEGAVHLLVEVKVEGVQALADVAKAGLLEAAGEEAILAPDEFILDEPGDEIDGGKLFGLGLEQAGLEPGGHARAAELMQRVW